MNSQLCVICLMSIKDSVSLPCGHTYCRQCIDAHLSIQSRCPLCRRVFCKLIGEDYPSLIINRAVDFKKNYPSKHHPNCDKNFTEINIKDCHQNPFIPLVQHLSYVTPAEYTFQTISGIKAVNIALKSNLLIAFQPIYMEKQRVCQIMRITSIKRLNNGEDGYFCVMERIYRAKILNQKRKTIPSDGGYFCVIKFLKKKILTMIHYETIIDDVNGQQQEIFRLFYLIEELFNNLQCQLTGRAKDYFNSTFPKLPSCKNYEDLTKDDLNQISIFSISAIESIMLNDLTKLQINYQVDLRKRLEMIINHLKNMTTNHLIIEKQNS